MIRAAITAAVFAATSPVMAQANESYRPDMPDWQTDAANCSWHWREGGGVGLWAETCRFNDRTWQVVWDEDRTSFVTRADDSDMGIAAKVFDLHSGSDISALSRTLVDTGALDANAACIWKAIALRPAPRTMAFHVLTPADQTALSPTSSGEIPEPVCGPYGASTHGVRYFMTDLRWPAVAIFIDQGQERPFFEPASITSLP